MQSSGYYIGQKTRRVKNDWYDEECKEKLEEQKNECLRMLQRKTRNNVEDCKEGHREARKVCREKKKEYEETKLEELQEKYRRNRIKQFYEGIQKIRTGFQTRTTMCKNKKGEIAGKEKEVLDVWATYLKNYLIPKIK
jgi:hypothetical protein